MKRILTIFIVLSVATGAFAQQRQGIGFPDPERIGVDSAQQYLKEVSVEKFEKDGYWISYMSSDDGYVTTRLFSGAPAGKDVILEEEGLGIQDRYVLGTRVDFIHRGYSSARIYPIRPIPIEGITKTVSVWVVGRNYNHELILLLEDTFGHPFELNMGKLNFQGWKQLTVAIPPQADDALTGIIQRNYHYNNQMGIRITGFRIDFNPWEAYGSYYVYFDDLRAVTDLFAEDSRDADDMPDGW